MRHPCTGLDVPTATPLRVVGASGRLSVHLPLRASIGADTHSPLGVLFATTRAPIQKSGGVGWTTNITVPMFLSEGKKRFIYILAKAPPLVSVHPRLERTAPLDNGLATWGTS